MPVRDELPGPAELVQMAAIARHHYVDGMSKVEISEQYGLSRFKVARMLDAARQIGLVRIEIGLEGRIDIDLSVQLQDAFGLEHAVVVDSPEVEAPALRRQLGRAGADLLGEIVHADDVLGLSWARAVSAMTRELRHLAPAPVVQLTGALSRADIDDNSVELVREAVRVSGGRGHLFYAPLTVPDAATAHSLRQQPQVREAFSLFRTVTKAVVGIGRWAAEESTIFDAASPADRRALTRAGVTAEVSGIMLDRDGELVDSQLTERMIAIDGTGLRDVPEVIGIAYGSSKAPAVVSAVRGGLVNSLVTHTDLARRLLDEGPGS